LNSVAWRLMHVHLIICWLSELFDGGCGSVVRHSSGGPYVHCVHAFLCRTAQSGVSCSWNSETLCQRKCSFLSPSTSHRAVAFVFVDIFDLLRRCSWEFRSTGTFRLLKMNPLPWDMISHWRSVVPRKNEIRDSDSCLYKSIYGCTIILEAASFFYFTWSFVESGRTNVFLTECVG